MLNKKIIYYLTTYQYIIIYLLSLVGCSFLFALFSLNNVNIEAIDPLNQFISMNYYSLFRASLEQIKAYFIIMIILYVLIFIISLNPIGTLLLSLLIYFKFYSNFLVILQSEMDLIYISYILFELMFEIVILFIISICSIEISLNIFNSAFIDETNLDIYKMLNYFLNHLLIILILHCIHILFIIYLF